MFDQELDPPYIVPRLGVEPYIVSGGKTDEEQGATMQSTGDTDGPCAELYTDMMGKALEYTLI